MARTNGSRKKGASRKGRGKGKQRHKILYLPEGKDGTPPLPEEVFFLLDLS